MKDITIKRSGFGFDISFKKAFWLKHRNLSKIAQAVLSLIERRANKG